MCDYLGPSLQDYLAANVPTDRPIEVFYVCGADHYTKCGLSCGLARGAGVVVPPRDGKIIKVKATGRHVFSTLYKFYLVY